MKTKARFGLPAGRLLGFLILALCFSCLGSASDIVGEWAGSTKNNSGMIIPVTLTVNQQKANFEYGASRSCTLEFEEIHGQTNTYSATKSNGGFCDQLYPGTLLLKEGGDGTLSYVLTDNNNKELDSSSLKRR